MEVAFSTCNSFLQKKERLTVLNPAFTAGTGSESFIEVQGNDLKEIEIFLSTPFSCDTALKFNINRNTTRK